MNDTTTKNPSGERFTPVYLLDRIRTLLGKIDLDPASSKLGNQLVGAGHFFGPDGLVRNGLEGGWHGRVLLHPPGRNKHSYGNPTEWWWKLVHEWSSGSVDAAVFVADDIALLQNSQMQDSTKGGPHFSPFDFPFMVPAHRLEFLKEEAGQFVVDTSSRHANVVVFLPPYDISAPARFEQLFSDIGRVVIPTRLPDTPCRVRRRSRPKIAPRGRFQEYIDKGRFNRAD